MERDDADPVGPSGLHPDVLDRLLGEPGVRWLDVGADGADLREDVQDWHGAWDVVSCPWTAFQRVDAPAEIDEVVARLVRWVAPGGTLVLPLLDLEDLRGGEVHHGDDDRWVGTATVTATTWHRLDADGVASPSLVAPQAGHVVALVAPSFERVEVLRAVPAVPGGPSPKTLVASGRRPGDDTDADDAPAEVVLHPPVRHPDDLAAEAEARAAAEREVQDAARREAEAAEEAVRAHAERAEVEGAMRRQIDRDGHELEYLRAEVHRLHRLLGEKPPPEVVVSTDVSGASTAQLVRVVLARANPFAPGFGRRVTRRFRR